MRDSDSEPVTEFEADGYWVIPDVVSENQCGVLARLIEGLGNQGAGLRGLLSLPWCIPLAASLRQHAVIARLLPDDPVAIQCTLFDKSPERNWLVAMHQDLSIPVRARVASLECSGWSEKEGQLYVQPSVDVLEKIVAVRVHIDHCSESSGALRVVPGSHRRGRLDASSSVGLRNERGELPVAVSQGGALVMRPLLLHASSKSIASKHRRVLHFVFAPRTLPHGLQVADFA
jgi:hypothetical protein